MRDLAARHGVDQRRLVAEHAARAQARFYQGDTPEQANERAYEHVMSNLVGAMREAA